MQTCSIIWKYSSYYAGVFLCKISPRTSIIDIVLLVFWFYFFVKNIFFFRMFIFQWIRYSNVVFYFRNMPSIKYVRNSRNGGGSTKMCIGAYRRSGVSRLICTYALTDNYSFHVLSLGVLSFSSNLLHLPKEKAKFSNINGGRVIFL